MQYVAVSEDLRRIVMATADVPVSIPRGLGRRVVTLYEALVRNIASGNVYRRAAVMDFIRLVQQAAAATPKPTADAPASPSAEIARLEEHLSRLRAAAAMADATQSDQTAVVFHEFLLDLMKTRLRR